MGVTRGRRRKWVNWDFGFGGMVGAETHWIGGCRRAKNGVIRKGMRCDGFIQEPIEDFDIAKQ